uniref:Hydrolase_4 domain-containing protein n=1 Tax=Angiostrongylus cantonensis TaxID=6313 RepID=A0A0K0D7H1_ANGCA
MHSTSYACSEWGRMHGAFLMYDYCGGRFPCDYVLPKIVVPTLIMNGGQDRFCGDAKACFLSVLKNVNRWFLRGRLNFLGVRPIILLV